jgi:thiazole synthase ThiGH ThiG subunit
MQQAITASGTRSSPWPCAASTWSRLKRTSSPSFPAASADGHTSGARNAAEAVRIARIAKAAGYGNWVKIEVINDSRYLLPDNQETIRATEHTRIRGLHVFPLHVPDLYDRKGARAGGASAVMPLGSLIGSNRGLRTRSMLEDGSKRKTKCR